MTPDQVVLIGDGEPVHAGHCPAMTLDEVIGALVALREVHGGEAPVSTEGCDCWGECVRIVFVPSTGVVLLRENSSAFERDELDK